MSKCEFGKDYTTDESKGCQNEARYLLQYSVDWKLRKVDRNFCADMEIDSCEEHVLNIDFVFNTSHGIPDVIYDYKTGSYRPGLVKKIEKAYEEWCKTKT